MRICDCHIFCILPHFSLISAKCACRIFFLHKLAILTAILLLSGFLLSISISSVRPSTPFSANTDTPIFCCQSNTIPIRYRFFDTLQERTWRRVTDQRLQTPPPQLITAVRRGPVAARRRMPLICRGQSNTATISKV